ncbi:CoA-transferase [Streptomyces prasinus]|uniref:CoA-transferase n=1 Tax=Streptomyces prasinus TaxID=67345 RepID=UPI0036A9D40F
MELTPPRARWPSGCGIPAFYIPAGVGTPVAHGGLPWRYDQGGNVLVASPPKEVREFHGRRYVLEEGIVADFALVHARLGGTEGPCCTARTASSERARTQSTTRSTPT